MLRIALASLLLGALPRNGPVEDPILAERERETLRAEAHGDVAKAATLAAQALAAACAQTRAAADPDVKATAAAHAEFECVLLGRLTRKTTTFAATSRALEAIQPVGLPPLLAARVEVLRAECAIRLGDPSRADHITRMLGFIGDWALIGPFDNERGGGFQRAEEPEKGFAPEQAVRGKERDVRWRKVPVSNPPLGVFNLAALMRPNQQASAYLRTTFRTAGKRVLVFRLGSDEAVRVWLNGRLVHSHDVRRPLRFDQDAVLAQTRDGDNELLVKVCTQEQGWSLACRITTPDGAPVTDLEFDPMKAVAAPSEAPDLELPSVAGDAIEFWSRAAKGTGDAESAPAEPADLRKQRSRAALRLAYCLRERRAEDPNEHADREAARAAVDLNPDDSIARVLYSATLRQETQVAAEKEMNPSRRQLEKAYEIDPENAVACVALAEHYLDELPIPSLAHVWLERALKIEPHMLAAKLRLASLLEREQLPEEAARVEREAAMLPEGAAYAPLRERIGAREWARGRVTEADRNLRAALAADRLSYDASRALESLLLTQERVDEALVLATEESKLEPFATQPLLREARVLDVKRATPQALEAIERALAICPEDAPIVVQLAHARAAAGDAEGAARELDRALLLDPKDAVSRRYLEYLRSSVKPFEDAFRVDAATLVPVSGPAVAAPDEPYEVVLEQSAFKLNPDGTTQRYEHLVVTIQNEEGARQLNDYAFAHDPSEERVRVRRARVIRADGRIDDAPSPPGSGRVAFPPLAKGDTIDVEARIDTTRASFFGNYFGERQLFHGLGLASTRRCERIFVAPSDRKLNFNRRNGAPEAQVAADAATGFTTYRFTMDRLPRPKVESSMPDAFELVPSVSVTTYSSWDEFTSWWWNLIQKQQESSPAMRDKIAAITRGKTTEIEKIRAVYDFVVTDIRYNAWEFGVHGYQPYNASTVFDRGHGDCKDKALLMNTMLRELGIRAYPVLIHADDERPIEDLSVPLIGLFNHCISYVPASGDRPAMFLDGTARDHPMGVLPDMDRGASVVVVEDGKPRFENVGYPEPDQNLDACEWTVDLRADGSATATLAMLPKGRYDVLVRELFGNEQGAQKENLERMLTPQVGRARVTELRTSDLHDLSVPVELHATVEIERLARAHGQDLALPMCLQPRKLLQNASEAQRLYDLVLGVPDADDFTVTYKLPEGVSVASLPGVDVRETPFGAYEMRGEPKGNLVVVRSRSRVLKPRVTPKEYGAFRQFARELDEAQAHEIVIRSDR